MVELVSQRQDANSTSQAQSTLFPNILDNRILKCLFRSNEVCIRHGGTFRLILLGASSVNRPLYQLCDVYGIPSWHLNTVETALPSLTCSSSGDNYTDI